MAQSATVPFVPQCGLAPGAINIIGSSYARRFKTVRSLELRVGALPLYASNSMKYYLSWSTAGLINEYCQLAEALYNGCRINTMPLEGLERLTIDGTEYEAFNTSGGIATMCETFEGCIGDLNYKTIRYPGHRDLMRFLLHDLNLGRNRHVLTQIFDQEVPLKISFQLTGATRFMTLLVRKAPIIQPTVAVQCNITYYFAICMFAGLICINFR